MKKLFTLLFISTSILGFTQTSIDNAGFENWSDVVVKDSVVNWSTSTMQHLAQGIDVINTYLISDSQDGASSIYLETEFYTYPGTNNTDTLFGYAIKQSANDQGFTGFPYTDTVVALNGWYKCGVMPNDTAYAIVELSKNGTTYSTGIYPFYGSQSNWTQFTVNLPGGGAEEPDSVFIGFASSDPFTPGVPKDGSWLQIDNISFEHPVVTPTQIPNQSFEIDYQETIQQPDSWWTFDPLIYSAGGPQYTAESPDAVEGVASLEIETTTFNTFNNIPSIVTNGFFNIGSGNYDGGKPYIAQPDSLIGQYKYIPSGIDTAFVWLQMWNGTTGTLVDTFELFFASASWTEFSIPLNLTEAPDSMRITIYSGASVGSILRIDDLDFVGGDLSTDNTVQNEFDIYPNPATEDVTINTGGANQIEILNISGKIIYKNTNSKNILEIKTSEWDAGIYFVRVLENRNWKTRKLIIR